MRDEGLIRTRGLRAWLGGREVLHGIDLTLGQRWTSIVGPNGAGKTTLLKSLGRLLPYEGQVELQGRDLASWPHAERARTIAWLGQNEGGAEDLLAHDVAMLGRLPHQGWLAAPGDADRAAVDAAMRETQCWEWRDRPLGQLSGGERQRVLLARALAVGAKVLLMDEPVASLDPPHQADWLRIVQAHVSRGGAVVSVLHELTLALHADDLVVMDQGVVVHHGSCSDPASHRALEAVFSNRVAVHAVEGQWVAVPRAS